MASNAFNQSRQYFHDLRGRLTVILTIAALVRDSDSENLTDEQRDLLSRIERTVQDMLEQMHTTSSFVLDALAMAPASGTIWESACLHDHLVETTLLDQQLAMIRATCALPSDAEVILIAPAEMLPVARDYLQAQGFHVRVATSPSDLFLMIERQPIQLLVLAPPIGSGVDWWRTVRITLRDLPEPIFLHLGPISTIV